MLAPRGRDGAIARAMLAEAGLIAETVPDLAALVAALLSRAKGLRAWLPGKFPGPGAHQGEAMDSYYYLLLKMRHGRVVDVLP